MTYDYLTLLHPKSTEYSVPFWHVINLLFLNKFADKAFINIQLHLSLYHLLKIIHFWTDFLCHLTQVSPSFSQNCQLVRFTTNGSEALPLPVNCTSAFRFNTGRTPYALYT